MRLCLVFLFACFFLPNNNERESLIQIRDLYEESAEHKASSQRLLQLLSKSDIASPLMKGYKGAALMIEANHLVNPLSKWNRFKAGKNLIEQAIKADPANVEMRYIRLTIQTNLPGFLRYSSNIQADKKAILSQLPKLKDYDLTSRMANYLLSAGICSSQEIKTIQSWKNR